MLIIILAMKQINIITYLGFPPSKTADSNMMLKSVQTPLCNVSFIIATIIPRNGLKLLLCMKTYIATLGSCTLSCSAGRHYGQASSCLHSNLVSFSLSSGGLPSALLCSEAEGSFVITLPCHCVLRTNLLLSGSCSRQQMQFPSSPGGRLPQILHGNLPV